MVDVDPKSKKYSAHSLQINDAFVNYPAVKASFQSYGTDCFDGGVTATDLISNWRIAESDTSMSLSTILMLCSPTTASNTYSIQACEQAVMRFPANTLLAALQKPSTATVHSDAVMEDITAAATQNGSHACVGHTS